MRKVLPPPPPVSFWDPQTWPAPHDMAGLLMERSVIVAIAVVLLPFLVLGLRSFITAGRHATAAAQASSSKNTKDAEDEDEDEDIPIFRLALARLRSMRFSPGELVASVVAQLGQTAFLITSSFVAVVAVTLQTLSHRSRALRGDTVARQIEAQANGLLAKAKAQVESFSIHAMARKAFKDADISGDGSVNAGEVYAAVLSLYLQIGMLAKVTPPDRAHVLKLASRFDMDGSGELGEEEFVLFVTVLFENVAARVAAQVSLAGLISPYLSGKVTAYGSEMTELKAAAMRMIPQVAEPYVGRGTVETAITASLVAVLVPFSLSLIDEVFLRRANAKTAREIRRRRKAAAELKAIALVKSKEAMDKAPCSIM